MGSEVAAGPDGHRGAASGHLHGLAHDRGTDDRLGGLGRDDAGAHRGAGAEAEAEGVHGHGSLHFDYVKDSATRRRRACRSEMTTKEGRHFDKVARKERGSRERGGPIRLQFLYSWKKVGCFFELSESFSRKPTIRN